MQEWFCKKYKMGSIFFFENIGARRLFFRNNKGDETFIQRNFSQNQL